MSFLLISLLFSSFACASGVSPKNATRPLTLLGSPDARCMDGTKSGFYYHPSPLGAAQTNWVLTLQGGGECVSSKCDAKVRTALGSSKYFPESFTFWKESKVHLADTSCTANPVLCEYHQVFLPYCSQDLWSGRSNSTTPASSSAPGYYFSGHLILRAVIEELSIKHGLSSASSVILSGLSAGGFGVYNNVDWLADRLPKARVVGAPIAGYEFYAWPYRGTGHTGSDLADFTAGAMASGTYNNLWDSMVPQACLSEHKADPGACLLPSFSYRYVKAPLFIIEAQSDSVVLMYHDWVPAPSGKKPYSTPIKHYMAQFASNQTGFLSTALAPKSVDGVFNPACFIHTGFDNNIKIDDGTGKKFGYLQAFRSWLGGESVKLADKCAAGKVLCNPSCPSLEDWREHI